MVLHYITWIWQFFLFLVRGTCVAIADFWIMYVRVGQVWRRSPTREPSMDRPDLVMQLSIKSPCHSTVSPLELSLLLNSDFIDQQLWKGLSSEIAAPSAVVTGVSCGGIGFFTTLFLLLSGVNVHAVSRNASQAKNAVRLLQKAVDHHCQKHKEWNGKVGRVMLHHYNLNDTKSVAALADTLLTDSNLRIIVCNAGPMATPLNLTMQNLEEQFGVHYVGHSLLVLRLLQHRIKLMRRNREMQQPFWRIVVLSSGAAATAQPDKYTTFHEWKSADEAGDFLNRFDSYGNAKMCELLFALELSKFIKSNKRLAECCSCNVLHPGPIRSRVIPNSLLPLRWLLDGELAALFRMTPVIAALYVLDLALSVRHGAVNGHFFRMAEDEMVFAKNMVDDPRLRVGFFKNSTLFPGIPGPEIALSTERQKWLWNSTLTYFHDHDLLEKGVF